MMSRQATITTVAEHPNLAQIRAVLAQVPHIGDDDLRGLAGAWTNTQAAADARDRALRPDSPLVLDVLTTFESVRAQFADDLEGAADYVTVPTAVTVTALKAVRDAVAAAFARPTLGRSQFNALYGAWHAVFPTPRVGGPDFGPGAGDVRGMLAEIPRLAARCHDADAAARWDEIAVRALVLDEQEHDRARASAWQAGVISGRRRLWALGARSGAVALSRGCPACRRRPDLLRDGEQQRVLALCSDAVGALLVADLLDDATYDVLTAPVGSLVPAQRRTAED